MMATHSDTHGSVETARGYRQRRRRGRNASRHAGPFRRAELGVFAAVALVFVALAALPTAADVAAAPPATRLVRVESSDTLWGIASEYAAPDRTTAQTVGAIRSINRLDDGAGLQPGTMLAVPCVEAADAAFALR
jgi:Tfp pilus assembly protein FimV